MADDNVIDIESRKPHLSGSAHCIVCKHTWIAVAPHGCFWLKCPECEAERGVFSNHLCIPDGEERFACSECDVQCFMLGRNGAICLGCGLLHTWETLCE